MKKVNKYAYLADVNLKTLERVVDNGVTVITIPTPEGWRCDRKGCGADYMHSHSTFAMLERRP